MWPWSTIRELKWQLMLQSDSHLERRLKESEDTNNNLHDRVNWYKGLCFDGWRTARMQQKGMNRMARKIKRLQAENKRLLAVYKHYSSAGAGRDG